MTMTKSIAQMMMKIQKQGGGDINDGNGNE